MRVWRQFAPHDRRVGARTIRKRDVAFRKKKERLTFWRISAILAVVLVAIDMRADPSDFKSTGKIDDSGALPVGWPDLNEGREVSVRARTIGYMMDEPPGPHDKTRVPTFCCRRRGTFCIRRIDSQSVRGCIPWLYGRPTP